MLVAVIQKTGFQCLSLGLDGFFRIGRFLSDWIGYFFRIGYIKYRFVYSFPIAREHSIFIVNLRSRGLYKKHTTFKINALTISTVGAKCWKIKRHMLRLSLMNIIHVYIIFFLAGNSGQIGYYRHKSQNLSG